MTDIELVDDDDAIFLDLASRFPEYNASHSTWNRETFCCVVRETNRIVAGGQGIINMGALEVRGLWVDENFRGSGLGKQILCAIEEEAKNRGASRAMLYTFSWQAESFYKQLGYTEYSRFHYPDGPERIDMQKELSSF